MFSLTVKNEVVTSYWKTKMDQSAAELNQTGFNTSHPGISVFTWWRIKYDTNVFRNKFLLNCYYSLQFDTIRGQFLFFDDILRVVYLACFVVYSVHTSKITWSKFALNYSRLSLLTLADQHSSISYDHCLKNEVSPSIVKSLFVVHMLQDKGMNVKYWTFLQARGT